MNDDDCVLSSKAYGKGCLDRDKLGFLEPHQDFWSLVVEKKCI